MASKNSSSLLLADLIEHPGRAKTWHNHQPGKKQERSHGLRDTNEKIDAFVRRGLVRDKFPNFFEIGFRTQAFIDIHLKAALTVASAAEMDLAVRHKLNAIDNVVLVYTVFGDVDLRCKVVCTDLRELEQTAMTIRGIEGVASSTTSIVLDDTDYHAVRGKWARMIRERAGELDPSISRHADELSPTNPETPPT